MSDTPRTDVWLIEKYDLSMGPYRSLPQMFMQEALHQHSAPADWRKSYKVAAERIAQLERELAEWKARAEAVEGELAEVSKRMRSGIGGCECRSEQTITTLT